MRLLFDSRWISAHGIGRVASEMLVRLKRDFDVVEFGAGPKPSHPLDWLRTAAEFHKSGAAMFVSMGYNGSPLLGASQVFVIHDLIHLDLRGQGAWARRLYYQTIIRTAAQRATNVLTISQATARRISAEWPECAGRLRVCPNGLSDAFRQDLRMRRDTVGPGVLMFANDRWHKNLPTMLDGYVEAQRLNARPIPLTMIGEPTASVEALIAARGLTQQTVWTGRIDDDALAVLYASASALMICSLDEGFALPVIEALALGCPVVASDLDVFREVGGRWCIYANPQSPADMAAALRRALTDLPGGLGADARQFAQAYTWDRPYRTLKEILVGVERKTPT
jgi:glycosyltransferase involved in cell wall biosynthesis